MHPKESSKVVSGHGFSRVELPKKIVSNPNVQQ
jgi:hypothetical protein